MAGIRLFSSKLRPHHGSATERYAATRRLLGRSLANHGLIAVMSRFVVLEHRFGPGDARQTHWDLMLDVGDHLRTWALEQPPESTADRAGSARIEIAAKQLPPHRRVYLEYEGPISGDRGWVTRWDEGDFELLSEQPHELELIFSGKRFTGRATISLVETDESRWTLRYLPDDGAAEAGSV